MSATGVPFDTKLRFFAKQVAWIIVMFILLPICMWGIFLGWQYRRDTCVQANKYYIGLAWWIITTCVYNLICTIIIMTLLCCHITAKFRRCIIWPLHLINLSGCGVGLWLVINSEVNGTTCDHNELWIYSVIIVSLTLLVALVLGSIRCCMSFGVCMRFGRFLAIEDSPYQYRYGPPLEKFNNPAQMAHDDSEH